MKLLTKALRNKLIANYLRSCKGAGDDIKPVVKFFNPIGAATWLFTELKEDGDTLFGLCDLGVGEPELGYASLEELSTLRGRFGVGIERDLYFKADKTIGEYAAAARAAGRIEA